MAFKEGLADVPASQAKVEVKPPKLGDSIPMNAKVFIFKDQDSEPKEVSMQDIFAGKRAVLFGLPGAYTSVCSSKHVPEFYSKHKELQGAGAELIACVSVNDPYVMRKWAEELKVPQDAILMLADGDASFHQQIGLTQVLPGLGERARRYSMYLEDGKIRVLNIEEPGGKNYKISGPSHMLNDLAQLKKQ